MQYRTEKDTMGPVQVPADKYWGAQTQRSVHNFPIGPSGSMPVEIIQAFGYLKKAAALTDRIGHPIQHELQRSNSQQKPCFGRQ
jgi:fumarate hydratase class II